ncbi:MAG: AAA family ATPase [bacterium]
MGFAKMVKPQYPPRLWTLAGFPGSGKSTFAAQMRPPLLAIDADRRFSEVLTLAQGEVYSLSETAADNANADKIVSLLKANMPGSQVNTIVVDSLSAIISPLVTQAIMDNDAGRNRNRAAAFKNKALAMRQLQDAVTCWGKDVLWIYHLKEGRDGQGNKVIRPTVPETELERLKRSINLQLEIVQDGERRGIKVVWARQGRNQITLWDETGRWLGMPERIEATVYGGLPEQEKAETSIPKQFANIEAAIEWGMSQGVFQDPASARQAYDEVKQKNKPKTAAEMASYWTTEVLSRQKK